MPQEAEHSASTTTPKEVGFIFFKKVCFGPERAMADLIRNENQPTVEEFFAERWGSHVGRAVMRAMGEPDRLAPIDVVNVYHNELAFARFPNESELTFFEDFVELHGVMARP